MQCGKDDFAAAEQVVNDTTFALPVFFTEIIQLAIDDSPLPPITGLANGSLSKRSRVSTSNDHRTTRGPSL